MRFSSLVILYERLILQYFWVATGLEGLFIALVYIKILQSHK
jgi:hypothetical protein